ncbi:glucokinase [Daejeonella rubra]|uniref:Glucokinase n=1 Tax=Daejeonella rubra TaxID=990371 RepID=A0A1G9UWU0_9SPHI|nr:glucokinase [Daejeonella rubra]SDM64408.1 glucokinase [Daejeonella rubra]
MLLPFEASLKHKKNYKTGSLILAGDIGGTKTNLTLYKVEEDQLIPVNEAHYITADYNSLIELTSLFMQNLPDPDFICFGVAGPVISGHAKFSNIKWEVDSKELSEHFNKMIYVINDLEATAYGLAMLSEKEVTIVHKGIEHVPGNAAVIAPGTGLGEAGLYWDGKYYHPFATEGGHSDFAPRSMFDFELFLYLQKQFGHVSWERLLSGPGIIHIYQFLIMELKRKESAWLKEKFVNGLDAAVISQNVQKCNVCKETMEIFIRYLAYESANLVLKFNATGGLYIGGGIAPYILDLFESNDFKTNFCQSGRLNDLVEKVTVYVILNTKAALLGAAWYGIKN